jgi:hypothetical protein
MTFFKIDVDNNGYAVISNMCHNTEMQEKYDSIGIVFLSSGI